MRHMSRRWVFLPAIILPFLSIPAVAAEQKRLVIEEVVVTARKLEESVQDVPIAMTAISQELKSSTIRDISDLNGFAPNVQIGEDGSRGGGGASITIRGISPTRTDDNSFDSPIGVMIDGIYLGSLAGQVLENFDLERVEILRGPQGTLFGKNTVGGVVHVLRSRPTGEFGARFKATIGEDGQQELRAVVNTSLVEDQLAAKFFATTMKSDGFMKNVTLGRDAPEGDYKNYGVTFLATPNDSFEALFTIEKFHDQGELNAYHTNYNAAPGVIAPPTDPNESDYSGGFLNCTIFPGTCRTSQARPKVSENDTANKAELDTDAYTLNMRYDLNENLTIASITGYRKMDEYRIFDFDGSAAPFITIERKNDYDQFSQELRIDGTYDKLKFTAGVYYWNSEFEQDWVTGGLFWSILFGAVAADPGVWGACQAGALAPVWCDQGLAGGIPAGNVVTQILYETQETNSVAAFAQADWEIADNWTLTAGLRWTKEEKDFRAGQAYLSNIARQWQRNFPEYADLKNTWYDVSPKLGLTYRLNDDAIIYGSYSEGFHSGGFFGVNQNTRDFIRDQYDPELAESYEIGFKSTIFDGRMRFNLTAFRNDFQDKQEQSVQVDPQTKTVATTFDNVASARYQGIELETQYVVSEYAKVFFNYGYLDAEYDSFITDINAADGVTILEDASFLEPRNAPSNTIGLGGTLTFPVGPGEIEIYAKYARIGDLESNLLNTPLGKVDARKDITASIGFYAEKYSIVAYGRNLTDERFEIFTPIATLFAVGSVNRPRTYGLEFSYEI